jgi:hypothetical protein
MASRFTHPGRFLSCGRIDSFIHSFHLVVCLTTGSKPLPKRAVHIVRSRASSFRCEYPLLSLRSSSSFLCFLPRLPVTSIPHFIFPSVTCRRRQFLRKMWQFQLALRLFISCRIFLCSLNLSNASSFLTWSVQLIFSILLLNHISKLSRCFWSTARSVQVSAPYKAILQMWHFTSLTQSPLNSVSASCRWKPSSSSCFIIFDHKYYLGPGSRDWLAVC